jgi:hypothetical protein
MRERIQMKTFDRSNIRIGAGSAEAKRFSDVASG